MPPYNTSQNRSPLPPPSPALKWATRIFITLFTLPFFAVGFSMMFGGGFLGTHGGVASPLGWFGSLFGLAFIAVPSLMLVAVWFGKFAPPQAPSPAPLTDRPIEEPPNLPQQPQPAVAMQSCTYCGRPRPASEPTCPSCGAH